MGVNGERRITPLAPGCQPSITVVGADGETLLLNHIFRPPPGTEGSGPKGQLAIDISPTQPHTMTTQVRACESCHSSEKALGYGIGGSRMTRPPDEPLVVDLETVDGHILEQIGNTPVGSSSRSFSSSSRFRTTLSGQQPSPAASAPPIKHCMASAASTAAFMKVSTLSLRCS